MTGIDRFESFPSRIVGERDERIALAKRALRYHQTVLDDYLRGILPHDLVLIGAPTGMGKTDLAMQIATSNAFNGKHVAYFALEAEPRELERRTKYALLYREAWNRKHPRRDELNYADWLLGACEDICGEYNQIVDQQILSTLSSLRTFYRGNKFDAEDLRSSILEIYERTDLIVVDHLHYIDFDDENETRSLGDTVKTIRDVSLNIGKPVILIAHLRKRDTRAKQIVATTDDFHGSSNITKICTQVITIEAAQGIEASKWYLAPTFMSIPKDRRSGALRLVAVANFDRRGRFYRPEYTLGRVENGAWTEIDPSDRPRWAVHHTPRSQL